VALWVAMLGASSVARSTSFGSGWALIVVMAAVTAAIIATTPTVDIVPDLPPTDVSSEPTDTAPTAAHTS